MFDINNLAQDVLSKKFHELLFSLLLDVVVKDR